MANRRNIQLWIDALESGRFLQGNGFLALRDAEGRMRFCCLGVACEVAIANGVEISRRELQLSEGDTEPPHHRKRQVACRPVVQQMGWLGVEDAEVQLVPPKYSSASEGRRVTISTPVDAVQANDYYKMSFGEIAALIHAAYLRDD